MIKDLISEVHCVDNMEYMATIPDKFFDLVIADPEYGININNNIGRRKGDKHSGHKKVNWDSKPPDRQYFDELFRISKNQIIWGGNYFNSIWANGCKGFVIWDKMFSEDVSFSMYEFAWTSFDKTPKGFKYSPTADSGKVHPTQKPIKLYKWLLNLYASSGDKIFDPNMGSQSSRIACYDMGFDYWGCELDKDYFEAGNNRFNQHIKQGVLF